MSHYHHLTIQERESAMVMLATGTSITDIAKALGRHKSTISRELRRNCRKKDGYYSSSAAQKKYEKRRKSCGPKKMLVENKELRDKIHEQFIELHWSPDQIANRLLLEGTASISYQTIYRGINAKLFDEPGTSSGKRGARKYLRHRGKPRKDKKKEDGRGKALDSALPLSQRPEIANQRGRIGDWEADTVKGKSSGARLVVLVDRHSRYVLCAKAASGKVEDVTPVIIELLKGQVAHTITPDRGPEFNRYQDVCKVYKNLEFYYPPPQRPQDRGTSENSNGLLREYFPKGCDLDAISDEEIREKVAQLNLRPRKCLGYKTPYEVYHSVTLHLT